MAIRNIDRQVSVLIEGADLPPRVQLVSELREHPFLVLIGEPGIGKSTVFAQEAEHEGTKVLKVRALMTGTQPTAGETLFLDGLDEFRVDGQAADKAYGLANAIGRTGAARWRISCRSEDWRKEADIAPIRQIVGDQPIVVAQLLPLSYHETLSLLEEFGESSPRAFVDRAHAWGAAAFLESPLTLKLLHKAVENAGQWPKTRKALFAAAIRRMTHEANPEYQYVRRNTPQVISTAAGHAFLLLLLCGARAIWRTNAEPPLDEGDKLAFLTAGDLRLEPVLFADMLDTALFRGEGQSFEWIHRSVAEYLAARALADAVRGSVGRAAIPLSRAIAWITGTDGGPPTELRGLFAWFVVHLADDGDLPGAQRLIDLDLATVLAYGDASSLSPAMRRIILHSVGLHDPYFRSSESGTTSVAGFIDEDLAADAAAILGGPPDGTHRTYTLLEALAHGPPVQSLRPVLFGIASDPKQSDWMRKRSADAWLNGASDRAVGRRTLFDALSDEPPSVGREVLRMHLASGFAKGGITAIDLKSMLHDYQLCREDNVVGRLHELERRLEAEPVPGLFDEAVKAWLPESQVHRHSELDSFINDVLAATISSSDGLTGDILWKWTRNVRESIFSPLGKDSVAAVGAWLSRCPSHELQLFDAIANDPQIAKGSPALFFQFISGRDVSGRVARAQLERASQAKSLTEQRKFLELAVMVVERGSAGEQAYWEVHARLLARKGFARLMKSLTFCAFGPDRSLHYKFARKHKQRQAKERAAQLAHFRSILTSLGDGTALHALDWAANEYFRSESGNPPRLTSLPHVVETTDEEIATAIVAGWHKLTLGHSDNRTPQVLGTAYAQNQQYFDEWPTLAGLERVILDCAPLRLESIPRGVELVVLKLAWLIESAPRRNALFGWAVSRLSSDADRGKNGLADFWDFSLMAGAGELPGLWQLLQTNGGAPLALAALRTLFQLRRPLPHELLRRVLLALHEVTGADALNSLSQGLADADWMDKESRLIWQFVRFASDSSDEGPPFPIWRLESNIGELLGDEFGPGLAKIVRSDRPKRYAELAEVAVRWLGTRSTPKDGDFFGDGVSQERRWGRACVGYIRSLGANPTVEANRVLNTLIGDATLSHWLPDLTHARAQQSRLRRDVEFKHPELAGVLAALEGGPPLNGADLRAVAVEELRRMCRELQTDSASAWSQYWNTDSSGRATEPKIENVCRNVVLGQLSIRLAKYNIAAVAPEAQRANATRADLLLLSHAGRTLPVEAKRHYHKDVWTAPATQLQGYANASDADGVGIYLVFWFGVEFKAPPRPDSLPGPSSATEMEAMLCGDLSGHLKASTEVVVMDVSNPRSSPSAIAESE